MATSNIDITEGIRNIIADHLSPEKTTIVDESRFVNDLEANSLDMVEIAFQIEDTFDVIVPYQIADGFVTVGDAIAFIRAQSSPPGATQEETDGDDFFQMA